MQFQMLIQKVLNIYQAIDGEENIVFSGVSALTISSCNRLLVSGGVAGQLRVWKIEPTRQSLLGVLKEHTSTIGSVCFNPFNTEVVSASTDGTCIIWDIPYDYWNICRNN